MHSPKGESFQGYMSLLVQGDSIVDQTIINFVAHFNVEFDGCGWCRR